MKFATEQYIGEVTRFTSELAALNEMLDAFAGAMREKLREKYHEGRGGWDSEEWSRGQIATALAAHVEKHDWVDVANFAMFLWNREEP